MTNELSLDDCKSYATEKGLRKVACPLLTLRIHAGYNDRMIIARNMEGRYTAIFVMDKTQGGYIMHYASHGFMSV